jgi:glycosyltransferase involved in cell wall biosynthesis
MKMLYAASLSYPGTRASHIQALSTAEELGKLMGDNFVFGAAHIGKSELYTKKFYEFGSHAGPLLAWKQMAYVKKHGCQAIFCREYHLLFWLMVYDRLFFHTNASFFYEAHGVDSWNLFRFRYVIHHVRGIIGTSDAICRDIRKFYSVPCMTIRNGVDLKEFDRPIPKEEARRKFNLPLDTHIALYVGSIGIHPWKGTDFFIRSSGYLNQDASVLCVLAGASAEMLPELTRIHDPLRVRFLPYVSRSEAAMLLHAADVLVLPNTDEENMSKYYTSPVKLFEYMASGVPIVASDLPSIREIVSDEMVLYVKAGDPKSLAQGIRATFSSPAEAVQRAVRARERVKQYSWSARAAHIIDFVTAHA